MGVTVMAGKRPLNSMVFRLNQSRQVWVNTSSLLSKIITFTAVVLRERTFRVTVLRVDLHEMHQERELKMR